MAEQPKKPARPAEAAALPMNPLPAAEVASPSRPEWKFSWQIPALIGAGAVLVAGVATAVFTAPKPDFDKMLRQAEQLIEHDEYDHALA